MIEESQIAAFPAEQQKAIRAAIEVWVKSGIDPRYLFLSSDGTVTHDVEEEGEDLLADLLKKDPP